MALLTIAITPPGAEAMAAGAAFALAAAASAVDIRRGLVPNWLTLPALLAALVIHALAGRLAGGSWWSGAGDWQGLSGALLGLAMGYLPMALCQLAGGIGGGDAKLMGAVGTILGGARFGTDDAWLTVLKVLLLTILAAALMAVVVMIRRRVVRQTLRRVWHTLLLVLSGAKPADPTARDSPKVPFAVAVWIATAVTLLLTVTGHSLAGR
jgi:prepilin peptidase CpaA